MDFDELQDRLPQTFEDGRLSRTERRALKAVFRDLDLSVDQRLLLANRAFDIARQAPASLPDGQALDWLEGIVKLLLSRGSSSGHRREAYFAPLQDCAQQLRQLFDEATSCVDVCVFTITDDSITRAILQAHRRGLAVRIITDDEKSWDRGSDIWELATAGVAVRLDGSEEHMHHKFAIFDRSLVVTGSYNWTRSASLRNQENIVLTDDRRLLKLFCAEFERLWTSFAPARQEAAR